MYLITTPWWLRMLFPGCIWQMPTKEKVVYLTFDDGPHPTATPFVLDQLKQFNAKGTFFCIGKNVATYPSIYQQLLAEGHTTGNHTMHHLNGWKTHDAIYLKDIEEAALLINSWMMRPPYGRIKWSQIRKIKSEKSKIKIDRIVMWSVIAADFDTDIDGEKCYQNVVQNIEPGSIIVFHDSAKALPRLQYALPEVLRWLKENGYQMKAL
jgi:peptidoglycan/xylan/chitin deacetylase (PgdA/CDA1 family)